MIDWHTYTAIVTGMWIMLSLIVLMDGSMHWKDKALVIVFCGVITGLIANAG